MKKIWLPIIASGMLVTACGSEKSEEGTEKEKTTEKPAENEAATPEVTETEESEMSEQAINDRVAEIDDLRNNAEATAKSAEAKEMSTEDMRPQIKQKWSKIHVYMNEDQIVRIKTYPHEAVSTRTEEFYFEDGALVLAVIEDDGSGESGKSMEEIDKAYYFHNGEVIREVNSGNEKEYSIRNSDGEQLLQEAQEYLELAR